ncbi:30S ribosomal protein S8e [Candidatus Woesearchaeota archaeon]|nr:30S ribosomal protein S8e [Candidatus Woesearchaeota archaeon]
MLTQSKDTRKISSGTRQLHRKKRLYERGNMPTLTRIGERRIKVDRVRGGNTKIRTLKAQTANVYDPADKKFKKANIKIVSNNPANRHYTRSNIMTKGAIIETDIGKARITSRPGQDGMVNAVLMEAEATSEKK